MPRVTPWTPPRVLALRAVALAHLAGVPARTSNATEPLGAWPGARPIDVHWSPLSWLEEEGLVHRLGASWPDNERYLPTTAGVDAARDMHRDLFPLARKPGREERP